MRYGRMGALIHSCQAVRRLACSTAWSWVKVPASMLRAWRTCSMNSGRSCPVCSRWRSRRANLLHPLGLIAEGACNALAAEALGLAGCE